MFNENEVSLNCKHNRMRVKWMFVYDTPCLYLLLIGANEHFLNHDKHMKQMCSEVSHKKLDSYSDKRMSTLYQIPYTSDI